MTFAMLNPPILQSGAAPPTAPPAPSDRTEFIREISRNFSGGDFADVGAGLLVFAGVVLMLLAIWLWRRHRTDAGTSRPVAVFRRVARKVPLSVGEQVLLARIARQQKLPTPLTLLLSSGTLEHHAQAFAQTLPEHQQRSALAKVERVQRKVFNCENGA